MGQEHDILVEYQRLVDMVRRKKWVKGFPVLRLSQQLQQLVSPWILQGSKGVRRKITKINHLAI
jgi:hypothetical protein